MSTKCRLAGSAASLVVAASLFAGSTGTTALHTMQGSGGAVTFGDYVSTNAGATLDTFYRYFIEVPPGVARLAVDVFDADIGLGGATEDTAGRDRDRGGYNSSVEYELRDPSGNVVPIRFTTGNAAGPTGADNAWLTLYSATGNTVRDNFTTAAYTNNDGNSNWTAAWAETDGGGGGATGGAIQITGGELRIQDGVGGTPSIQREADLLGSPGLNMQTAFFTFSYRTSGNLEGGDQLSVQVSANGGGSWTTLETFSDDSSGTRSYDITAFIANNTRIRFLTAGGLSGGEFFFFDDVQIGDGVKTPGHWELRIDMSSAVTGGDDINAFGVRAHDGNSGSGGMELNVYVDSMLPLGSNPPNSGTTSRSYALHPFVTSGCSCSQNDFDYDSSGTTAYSSASGAFTQSYTAAALSDDGEWNRDSMSGWTDDYHALDYGIWTADVVVSSYLVGGTPNGNYGTYYVGNFQAAANPPAANPITNAFRVYLPSDAGIAPVKPYLEQELAHGNFNPPVVGQTKPVRVTIRLVNPTPQALTFSTPTNIVTANVPGGGAVYGGGAEVSQGSVVSQPAVGGTGNITWNPGTLSAGDIAILGYYVNVTPVSGGQRIPVTATPASGNGTRARYLDETTNATQARATYLAGPLCELALTEGMMLTDVLLSSFEVERHGVSWTTASEVGTIGFNLYRADGSRVNQSLVPAKRNGRYRVDDAFADEHAYYTLEEVMADGRKNHYGPLNRLERAAPASAPARQAPPAKLKNAKKADAAIVSFDATGLARVTAAELATLLGVNPQKVAGAIRSGNLRITERGNEVAWTAAGEALLFFAEKSDSIYSDERAYRIELTRGTTMRSITAGPGSGQPSTFEERREIEQDVFAATVLPLDAESDYWFWDFVISGDATWGRRTFSLAAPAKKEGDARLTVRLQGAWDAGPHTARVSLNGGFLGQLEWAGLDATSATFDVPSSMLGEGVNEVAVEGIVSPDQWFDFFYVDGFTLEYTRQAVPENGQLEIPSGGDVTAGPFASMPVILDISDRHRPSLLQGAAFGAGQVSFTSSASALFIAETFLSASSGRSSAKSVEGPPARADWVVIAPRELRSGAEALAEVREREGLAAMVVDLEQLYDDFAGGNTTPHAIREFVASTRSWSHAPRYFVLAGSGTVDYRGIEVSPGLVPPLMKTTRDGIFASDSLFADFNGDFMPDVAIGRVPVATNEELLGYAAKAAAATEAAGSLIFSADAVDRGVDFRAASEQSRAALGGPDAVRIYLDEMSAVEARSSIIAAWNLGASLVSWVGHGGYDQLSAQGVLTAADAPSLTSAAVLPVVVAMTCTINRFEAGFVEPLGAALTRVPAAGALAVWSSSGLSAQADAAGLQESFMRLLSGTPGARVGDLIVRTLANRASESASLYLLLGDPAVRVSLPQEDIHGEPPQPGE